MQKVRYIGEADQLVLSSDDMLKLGFEDHPGLWFTQDEPVLEIEEDDIAELLTTQLKAKFKVEPADEEKVEELVDEKSRDDLADEARGLGIKVTSKMTKEEIADAIVAKQAENEEAQSGTVPSANEGEAPNPTA